MSLPETRRMLNLFIAPLATAAIIGATIMLKDMSQSIRLLSYQVEELESRVGAVLTEREAKMMLSNIEYRVTKIEEKIGMY